MDQDPDDYSESEYSPSESGSSDSSCSSELSEMDDEFWDEKRKDVDGEWYTRLNNSMNTMVLMKFWDNLDPNVYHQYRYDDQYGTWATKEEFYQHYGSDRVWKQNSSYEDHASQGTLGYLLLVYVSSKASASKFIKQMLETYDKSLFSKLCS